jgi:hypothetical protein
MHTLAWLKYLRCFREGWGGDAWRIVATVDRLDYYVCLLKNYKETKPKIDPIVVSSPALSVKLLPMTTFRKNPSYISSHYFSDGRKKHDKGTTPPVSV